MAVATATRRWTLEELHSLPDDGNKYELIHGELFVTPAPTLQHEAVAANLTAILLPYVVAQNLGRVFHPRAVLRRTGSEVEPDLMVLPHFAPGANWDDAPTPMLVVEILSPTTRRRDREHKRDFYLEIGVAEYWIVDPELRAIVAVRPGAVDTAFADEMVWHPAGASEPLSFAVSTLFR